MGSNMLTQMPVAATEEWLAACKKHNTRAQWCALCGKPFAVGDIIRFIYANRTPGSTCGNFFVCAACDGPDALQRGIENYKQTQAAAKRWGIYGPDWLG